MPEVPMIDDIELRAVQHIRQETAADLAPAKVLGLDGRVHQKMGRGGHRVVLSGMLVGDSAADDLATLQEKARDGEEVSFTANITTALEIETMVIASIRVEQRVGRPNQFAYHLVLDESPPLPPPATVSPFGGLDGLGDLGFDAGALGDVLSDIQDQAAGVMDSLDSALDAIEQLEALTGLVDIGAVGNPLAPITDEIDELSRLGGAVGDLTRAVGQITGEGG
jgi:hypothetical protein